MYDSRRMNSCLSYVDSELRRLQSRSYGDINTYELWAEATPAALSELEKAGAIKSAAKLSESLDYCAKYYDEWLGENEPSHAGEDDYEYNGRHSDIFEKKAGAPTERMVDAKLRAEAKRVFASLSNEEKDAIWSDEADLSDLDIFVKAPVRRIVHQMIQDWVSDPGEHK